MVRNCGACFITSPGMGKGRQSHPRPYIAASLAASRLMSAMEKQNATRDRMWPPNYGCWIRAPERLVPARHNGHTIQRRISHENDGEALGRAI